MDDMLDPSQREFWREGNYMPDEAFLKLAMNPTKENAKFWLLKTEIKNRQLKKIVTAVSMARKDLVRDGILKKMDGENNNESYPSMEKIKIFFIFDVQDKNKNKKKIIDDMVEVLKEWPDQVVPLQRSGHELIHFPGLNLTSWTSELTVKNYILGRETPLTIIYSFKQKKYFSLSGFQSRDSILKAIEKIKINTKTNHLFN
jgi:hypothetical protein